MFAKHRPQRALGRFLAPFQPPAVLGDHALAEIPIPLQRENLFDGSVSDLQRTAEDVFLHDIQRLSLPYGFSDLCLQLLGQFDQRFALDFVLGMPMLIVRPPCQGVSNEPNPA